MSPMSHPKTDFLSAKTKCSPMNDPKAYEHYEVYPGSSKTRTRYTRPSAVLAPISPSHHNPSSSLYQKLAPLGNTVSRKRRIHPMRML